jgi:hypothetical protein
VPLVCRLRGKLPGVGPSNAIMRWDVERMRPLAWRGVASARQLRLATLPKALVLAGLADAAIGQTDGANPRSSKRCGRHRTTRRWPVRCGGRGRSAPCWLLMSARATGTVPPLPEGVIVSRWNRGYLRFAKAVALGRAGCAPDAAAAFAEGDATMSAPVDVRWHRRHAPDPGRDRPRRPLGRSRPLARRRPSVETLGQDRLASACRGLLRRADTGLAKRTELVAFAAAHIAECLTTLLSTVEDVQDVHAVGIDMPLGLVETGWRQADLAVQAFVGARRRSVFRVPPRAVWTAGSWYEDSWEQANQRCRQLTSHGLSRQTWGLRDAGDAGPDDVLDAAAACSAHRIATGHASRLPTEAPPTRRTSASTTEQHPPPQSRPDKQQHPRPRAVGLRSQPSPTPKGSVIPRLFLPRKRGTG